MGKYKRPMSEPSSADYVDRVRLGKELVKHANRTAQWRKAGKKGVPPLSDYLGEAVLKIATRLSTAPNFLRYPFREDMVGDAVLACCKYIHNYDETLGYSPFAYATTICYRTFQGVIMKEKLERMRPYLLAMERGDSEFRRWFNEAMTGAEDEFRRRFGFRPDDKDFLEFTAPPRKPGKVSRKTSGDDGGIF